MPNTQSAKRALRQSERRRIHNLRQRRELLSVIKDYKKAVENNDTKNATEKLPGVYKKLDKAAKTHLIKKNKASRLKSRLTKKLRQSSTQSRPEKKTG